MKRTPLAVAIVLLITGFVRSGDARSPELVAHSPIPPLKAPHRVGRRNAPNPHGGSASILYVRDAFVSDGSGTRDALEGSGSRSASLGRDWDTEKMRMVHESVLEFARRSAQTSRAEAVRFLERLSQLPVDQRIDWLNRYEQRRESIVRAERRREQARREQWLERQRLELEGVARVALLQSTALAERATRTSGVLIASRKPFSDLDFEAAVRPIYNPLIPILDPSSPQGDAARAASLLGESFAATQAAAAPSALAIAAAPVIAVE